MKENQEITKQFVKIVERFPILYDNKMPHRNQVCMEAWEKVAEAVRHELKEQCTVDELRIKWKGIRSSFSRFKKKLHLENKETTNSKQYYLYDSLKFLHAHAKPKWCTETKKENGEFDSENEDEWVQNITIKALKGGVQSTPIRTYGNTKDPLAPEKKTRSLVVEPDVLVGEVKTEPVDDYTNIESADVSKTGILKRRNDSDDTNEASSSKIIKAEDNTDLQFFKSIIPDIGHFTTQEKRYFKMGVLKLIDEIEESRKKLENVEEFESTNSV
ncbi:hypothetical protein MSG28_002801 [Choristoneura fumiferana]|uniref:Uncharacterized protein n=1 Tax=Choristoneura fumiferana TaxID=7141 RepID=A0ACC0JJC1_CHOFU|nr:hypothetical protein MSG28_002801 [Choristoneura fumiferana]